MNDITIHPSDYSSLTGTDFSSDFSYKDKTRTRAILAVLVFATTIGGGAYWFLTHNTSSLAVGENVLTNSHESASADALTTATVKADADSAVATRSAPVPVGARQVHFGFNQARLTQTTKTALDGWAKAMVANDAAVLQIDGHADERGTRIYNKRLGLRRANAVKNYLIAQGVSAGQLRTFSYGESRPLVKGRNHSSWAKNRRVELHLIAGANSNN